MQRRPLTALTLAAVVATLAMPTGAAGKWVVPGGGFGHGVGMSQYGAFGLAKEGRSYQQILRHYFTGVKIAPADTLSVRVLLTTDLGSMLFANAREACGESLDPDRSYSFGVAGTKVALNRADGRRIKRCGREGGASGSAIRFSGVGTYRGKLIARNSGGSLYAINKVGMEEYVRGVIPNEVITSWPANALRAQAVAARSFALATRVNGNGYSLYDDARSQVYGGKSSEVASTNHAAQATAGEVIQAGGATATAYFFSTSGGQTENSEFAFSAPRSYLKAVNDPFDNRSPHHSWRLTFSDADMESRLSGLFGGNLKRISILKTGRSPRIVRAEIVGSSSSTKVSGVTLQFRLGLRSTWASFEKR